MFHINLFYTTDVERLRQHSLTTLTEVFPCFSSVLRQMPGLNSQSRGTDRISSELLSFVLCLSLCYAIVFMLSVVIMLYCYCVALLLFVLSYVLIVCTVPLPPGVNPIVVDKYICISTNWGWTVRGSYAGGGRDFPHQSRPVLGPTQPPVQWVPGLSRGVKRTERGFEHPLPSSAEVKERVELYLYTPLGFRGLL